MPPTHYFATTESSGASQGSASSAVPQPSERAPASFASNPVMYLLEGSVTSCSRRGGRRTYHQSVYRSSLLLTDFSRLMGWPCWFLEHSIQFPHWPLLESALIPQSRFRLLLTYLQSYSMLLLHELRREDQVRHAGPGRSELLVRSARAAYQSARRLRRDW